MQRIVVAATTALLLVTAQGAAQAQRGWSNPYPQYPQSPPGGGYFTDSSSTAKPETRPAPLCTSRQVRNSGC
jgi:hypothetical protein